MQTISDRLRSSANMCTRVNAAVTLLCEDAFIAANELERVTKQRDEALAKLDRAQSEIRALVLPGSIDHSAEKRRGKK